MEKDLNDKNKSKEVACGLFSKEDALKKIGEGVWHLHSATLGSRDACSRITQKTLSEGKRTAYPWELTQFHFETLQDSSKRYDLIKRIITTLEVPNKSVTADRIRGVLEEVLTNAIFHAYKTRAGEDKYLRDQKASLLPEEAIRVAYGSDENGYYFKVEDQGGSLEFPRISKRIADCAKKEENQIEQKQSGAGLGFFLSFEMATHICVDVYPGKSTAFSFWIANRSRFDPDIFSFNFFNWEE